MFIQNVNCWTHVTALAYFQDHILIGSGNKLEIVPFDSSLTKLVKWFDFGYAIHKIKVNHIQNDIIIAVCSNRFLTVLKLKSFSSLIDAVELQYSKNMGHWILDMYFNDSKIICSMTNNCIAVFDWINRKLDYLFSCPIKCLIYTSLIINCNSSRQILVASGTVLKQVIVWYSTCFDRDIIKCLLGHDGIIFALDFNQKLKLLCSASDDRSIRVWHWMCNIQNGISSWTKSKFDLLHVLYSHESRIWSLICLNDCLVSAGENDNLCFWDHTKGTLIKKSTGKENSIWCMAKDDEGQKVFLGSSDGSVRCKLIKDEIFKPQKVSYKFKETFPKNVKFLHYQGLTDLKLVTTLDNGCLNIFKKSKKTLEQESSQNLSEVFKSYSTLDTVDDKIFVGSKSNQVVKIDSTGHLTRTLAHNGKILSYFHLNNKLMATCGPVGDIKIWKSDTLIRQHYLPHAKYRWPTCGLMIKKIAIFGDRNGHIYLFADKLEPKQIIKSIHGRNGVTDIKQKPNSNLIYSCGREGKIFEYIFDESQSTLRLLRPLFIRAYFDWIAGIIFSPNTGDILFIIGFYSTQFMVWNEKEQSNLWSVECGGGHRNWDFFNTQDSLNFCFIKKNEIFWFSKNYHLSIDLNPTSMSLLIKDRYHANKINSCTVIFNQNDKVIFATSAEDNCIQINQFDLIKNSIQVKVNLSGHISSVKCVKFFQKQEKNFLISGGGRSQLIIWQIEMFQNLILFKQVVNHFLWNSDGRFRKNLKNLQQVNCPQIRYMCLEIENLDDNLLLLVGCSDTFLRFFSFHYQSLNFQLLNLIKSSEYCILSMTRFDAHQYITGSTDGYLRFWFFDKMNAKSKNLNTISSLSSSQSLSASFDFTQFSLLFTKQVKLHQSGINCIAYYQLSVYEWLIISGGDDAFIHLIKIVVNQSQISISFEKKISSAHYSLISGITFLNKNLILTASVDQRIKLWNCCLNLEQNDLKLMEIQSLTSSIADISCLSKIVKRKNNQYFIVAGEGVQVLKIDKI